MVPELVPLGGGDTRTRPTVKAVGVGGAGCNIVANSPIESVAVCKLEKSLAHRHDRMCTLTREHVRMFRTTSPQMFSSIGGDLKTGLFGSIGTADLMFLFTGLGGETGSYVTPALANICRKHCRMVIVSAALPFSVEGGERRHVAAQAMEQVIEHSDMVITYSNDCLVRIAPNLPIRKAFSAMDVIMMAAPMELANSLTREDLIPLRSDFSSNKHVRVGIGVGSGMEREAVAVNEAFTSPWFDLELESVKSAMVIVASGTIDEYMIDRVVEDAALRLPNARIRYSSRQDQALGEKVKVVVMLGTGKPRP
jgi:cell division protein FtsZ